MNSVSRNVFDRVKDNTNFGYYHILAIAFCFIFILSNISANKMSYFAGLYIDAGTPFFPILYIINDIITEVYGFKASRRVIWVSIFCNLIFVLLIYIVI
jgi:queuosine precursor transporter